jgi:hypothetical protein
MTPLESAAEALDGLWWLWWQVTLYARPPLRWILLQIRCAHVAEVLVLLSRATFTKNVTVRADVVNV